jgi:translation initiation factor IF-3
LTRVNERINVPEVRLIDEQGQQIGVLKVADALKIAQERDLDLVEVAPQARPPVARVLDYSKYKYEQALKLKQARKHQQQITVREIKFRPKIAQHDYDTKRGHVKRFLLGKAKVKITIMFRGREVAHPERGVAILDRLAEELSELAVVEQSPTLDGRNMAMLLAPSKTVLSGHVEAGRPENGALTNGAGTGDGVGLPDGAATVPDAAAAISDEAAVPTSDEAPAAIPDAAATSPDGPSDGAVVTSDNGAEAVAETASDADGAADAPAAPAKATATATKRRTTAKSGIAKPATAKPTTAKGAGAKATTDNGSADNGAKAPKAAPKTTRATKAPATKPSSTSAAPKAASKPKAPKAPAPTGAA